MLVEPVTEFIWTVLALDDKTKFEAHIQRIKRYSDASLNRTRALNLQAQNELDQFEVEKFVGWRLSENGLQLELKCRWRGFTDAWDTYEEVERHLWEFTPLRKTLVAYLEQHQDKSVVINALLNRLRSVLKRAHITARTSHERKHKRTNKRRNPKDAYERRNGGWIVPDLGSRRVFSTRRRALNALKKATHNSAKASGLRGLGGGVAVGHKHVPHSNKKASKPFTYAKRPQQKKAQHKGQSKNAKARNQLHKGLSKNAKAKEPQAKEKRKGKPRSSKKKLNFRKNHFRKKSV